MLNWLLSVLVIKDIITKEEATELSKELVLKTHPSNFRDAHSIVQKLLEDVNKNK